MQPNKPKALLIGSGYFGQILRPYIAKHCKILAIANTATSNLSTLLVQVDICFVITPLNAHFELAKAALQSGCHTFIEKPATSNAKEYRELLSLAKERNLVLFTDYIYTLSPSIRHALSLCKHKSLESIYASFTQYGKFYKNESVLEVLGVHYLSVFALMQELSIITDVEVQECVFLDSSRLSARLILSAKQGGKAIPITLECSLLSSSRQRVLQLFSSKEHCLQIDMLDSTPLSHKADKALESSLPIFDESGNLAHSLATFMSFIASDNLAKNVHYVAHTNVCARTACLLDSALGNHSADFGDFLKKHRLAASGIPCFRATADRKSRSTLKSPKNYESNTTKQAIAVQGEAAAGFFRNLRILEKENNQTELESSVQVDCHANASALARNDGKTQNLKSAQDSRSFNKNAKNLTTPQAEAKLDSSVDCHADKSARNDDEATQTKSPCDSKILELESGLFEPCAEIRLGGLSHKHGDEIHDSSPKPATAVQGEAAAGFFRKAESPTIKKATAHYDCIIIGGGFFGTYIASTLRQKYRKILIVEKERDLLLRASLRNQARVHNGYHYPRSLSTALSSARHFTRFCDEFAPAILNAFEKYYAIAAYGSKTSATQFYRLFKQFSIPIERASDAVQGLFTRELVEEVFCVQEYAFNANILREILQERLRTSGIEIALNTQAMRVFSDWGEVGVSVLESSAQREQTLHAPLVLNCTYAGINALLARSALPPLPLKYELTEMALVQVPESLARLGVTIMDGAFFSLMPYPAKNCYTLSHVRYTPHCAWSDSSQACDPYALLDSLLHPTSKSRKLESKFPLMCQDAARYLPELSKLEYIDSLYEIKTLRTHNEIDDGRPIIFAKDYGVKGFCTIMGGKIDNIYEIIHALQAHF